MCPLKLLPFEDRYARPSRSASCAQGIGASNRGADLRREDGGARMARRLYRKQVVDGLYRLDDEAVLNDCFHFMDALDVMGLLSNV
jgi:hypothetical protein